MLSEREPTNVDETFAASRFSRPCGILPGRVILPGSSCSSDREGGGLADGGPGMV